MTLADSVAAGVGKVTINNGGTLQLTTALSGGPSISVVNNIEVSGLGVGGKGAIRNIRGDNSLKAVALAGNTSIDAVNGTNLLIAGVLSDSVASSITINAWAGNGSSPADEGMIYFQQANTYRGSTLIQRGTLVLQNDKAAGTVGGIFVNAPGTLALDKASSATD